MTSAQHARVRLGIGTIPNIAAWLRREPEPVSVQQWNNLRREAEYVARRNGVKAPLLQIWRVS